MTTGNMMFSWPCLTGSVKSPGTTILQEPYRSSMRGKKSVKSGGMKQWVFSRPRRKWTMHRTKPSYGANWRPGDIRYADLDGDGIISPGSRTLEDPGDRRVIGNNTPRGSFGINSGISFKGFRLATFFQGILKRDHWPTSGNWTWFFPFNAGHVEEYFLADSWSEDNRDAYFAAPHISTSDKKNIQTQSRFLQNAGYIRLKNITLSYDLPQGLLSKIGLGQGQVYFTGMNLWEYSPIRRPLDPETIYEGAIEYPMQRIFTLGARVSL